MKLTKTLEAEVAKVYDTWLHSYLNGDVKTYDLYLDKDYHFIGSTDNEDFLTKKQTTRFLKTTADQLAGKCQIKNNIRVIEQFDGLVFITERFDANFLIGSKWVYYGKFRFSSVMQKKAEGWRFIYQHFSMPDSKAAEGETLGAEQVSKENQELRDAIKRRTAELEIKNRELEIEAALEKVRAIAMGMKAPDDMLEVCKTISIQLQSLGVKEIRNVQTAIIYEDRGSYMNYEYYAKHKKTLVTDTSYTNHKIHKAFAKKMMQGKGEFFITHIKGVKVKEWVAYQKTTNVFIDRFLEKASSLNYYWHSLGPVALGISTYTPLSKVDQELFNRFLNAFELAYTRYLDIEQAEAQVREAQIEASLERVRSRSMAMHMTSELQSVIHTVHQELLKLNIGIHGGSFIAINADIDKELRCWGAGGTADTSDEIHIPFYNKAFYTNIVKRIKKGPGFFTEAYTQKEKKAFFSFLFKHEPWKRLTAKEKKETLASPGGYTRSCCVAKHTSIFIINHFGEKFSDDENEILKRFGKVFEQTYTRFLDLKKAEAQAREAKIEAALEKVRSRSLAMHNSDAIKDVIIVVIKKLAELGIDMKNRSAAIFTFEKGSKDYYQWATSDNYSSVISLLTPYIDHVVQNDIWNAREKGTTFYAKSYSVEEKNTLFQYFFDLPVMQYMPEEEKKRALDFKYYDISIAFRENSGVAIVSHSGVLLTEEENEIIRRFSKVFEQAYVRFLDLQKAEAQAREAEIELALERVRARTMAMQKSDELKEVIQVVYDQFVQLNIHIEHTGFILDYKERADMHIWLADQNAVFPEIILPYFDCAHWNSFIEAKKKGKNFFANQLPFKEKNKFYKDLFKLIPDIPKEAKDHYLTCTALAISTVLLDNVGLYIENFEGIPYTDEENDVLMRFGKVFQQTYTRFLDLQKAEAQAREAQIEAAVERVRAQSMAMHQTVDLSKVTQELLNQLNQLTVDGLTGTSIYLVDANDIVTVWDISSPGSISDPGSYAFSYDAKKYPLLGGWVKTFRRSEQDYFVLDFPKEILIKAVGEMKEILPEMAVHLKTAIDSGKLTHQWSPAARLSNGILAIDLAAPPTADTKNIVTKMGGAFNQAYQRFLDLQKAEAQAREAQIEAALERTRTQSMIMQHSSELDDTLRVFHEQVLLLCIPSAFSFLWLPDENNDKHIFWAVWKEKNTLQSKAVNYPLDRNEPATAQCLVDWKEKKHFVAYEVSPAEVNGYFEVWQELVEGVEHLKPQNFANGLYYVEAYMKYGCFGVMVEKEMTEEEKKILYRIAVEFERTYTRFLDLQKSEAQAREAKIETALEKVRSRTMAMQNSNELQETAAVLFNEFKKLGTADMQQVTIGIYNEEERIIDFRVTSWSGGGEQENRSFQLDMNEPTLLHPVVAEWKAGKKSAVFDLTGKALQGWLNYRNRMSGINITSKDTEGRRVISLAYFSKGHISISSVLPVPQETIKTLERFAAVFDGTYTRFNDLQKAEAQAREAQIELGLERVRARAMAMQTSDELSELVDTVFSELTKLDFALSWCMLNIIDEPSLSNTIWTANPNIDKESKSIQMKFEDYPFHHAGLKAYRERQTKFVYVMEGDEKKEYEKYMFTKSEVGKLPDTAKKAMRAMKRYVFTYSFSNFGGLQTVGEEPLTEENLDILARFGKVFDLTYTRFNDLQKAEAQAKESRISLALERVRARAMAMQSSDELTEVATELRQQMGLLGQKELEVCAVHLYEGSDEYFESWGAVRPVGMEGKIFQGMAKFPRKGIKIIDKMMDLFRSDARDYVLINEGEKAIEWFGVLEKYAPEIHKTLIQTFKDIPLHEMKAYWSLADFSGGSLLMVTHAYPDEQSRNLLRRSANVFDLAYRRFKDLKKAEAQTREAQIELSLERIRAQALAMRVSADLLDIVVTMRTEFVALNHEAHYFWHMRWQPDKYEKAMTSGDGTRIGMVMELPRHIHGDIPLLATWEKSDEDTVIYAMDAEEAVDYVEKMVTLGDFIQVDHNAPTMDDIRHIGGLTFIMARTTHGEIGFSLPGKQPEVPEDAIATLVRFAGAFDLAYKRFEDLKTTEQRNREAQIELGLERVRARTMAMQHSDELPEAANNLFLQVQALGIPAWSCGYNILAADKKSSLCYMSSEGELQTPFTLPFTEHESLLPWYEAIQNNEEFFVYQQGGEELVAHYNYMKKLPELKSVFKQLDEAGISLPTFQINHLAKFEEGFLLFITYEEVPEAHEIFKRFAKVFEQTYTRFLDLKKAEAQAREAQIENALEKIRSRSLAMHKSDELQEVIIVVSEQLQQLNFRFQNVSFCVNNEQLGLNFWLASPGQPQPFKIEVPYLDNPALNHPLQAQKKGKDFITDILTPEENHQWLRHIFKHSVLKNVSEKNKEFLLSTGGFARSMVLMNNILLTIGNYAPAPYSDEENAILKRVGHVFDQAYTRFLDLKKAEAQALRAEQDLTAIKEAREKAEVALSELQLTQKQLIQSEKMASLGELTAGIAHEIQNPLNFVNNFSEVSRELLDEMREAIENGDTEDAKDIMNDVIQNLEKINHHGKRADGIVKGMLQHSRSSSGTKEPTDVNALADEYLRLAYHGLRAKDKTFNAIMKTEYEEGLEKIDVIPQDIGRVILNLITNAFYAVQQKQKELAPEMTSFYKPTVSLTTKKAENRILISVKDNGKGIPQNVLDKIFQPFFTTKPTGQGTGLGLSLSYDIVKVHGGELKVGTKEGEGTDFIVVLPVN